MSWGALQRVGDDETMQVLDHALADQQDRHHERQRKHDAQHGAGEVYPEVAERARPFAGQTSDQGRQHAHAGGRGDEVLHGQPGHLGEVAHRGFAAVGLPVGIGHEADRGVEGDMVGHRRLVRRIERQHALKPRDPIQQQEGHNTERKHGQGIGAPPLLAAGIDSAYLVDHALDRPKHPIAGLLASSP